MISAETLSPSTDLRSEPSPASSTSVMSIRCPASPASFSTTILSPGATRYCLPPVRTTANIGSSLLVRNGLPARVQRQALRVARKASRLWQRLWPVNRSGGGQCLLQPHHNIDQSYFSRRWSLPPIAIATRSWHSRRPCATTGIATAGVGNDAMSKLTVRSLILTTISPLAYASPALAQQNQQVAQEAPDSQVQEATLDESTIVVTGTRRADRTVADSPVPVDVIGSDAISNSGQTETNRILNQLVPSFNFPQPSIADGSDALRPATLRGLAPDQTLVLINGKRRHVSSLLNINGTVGRGSAAVDMNLIPGLAISRVEVLRDGAAAQYGSDAIAGVINVQIGRASCRERV